MIRIVLVNLLFLLLPTLIYFAYVYIQRRRSGEGEILENAPIFWLLAAGAGLMLAALVVLGQWETGELEGRYVPPKVEDGKVVPGHFEPLENKHSQSD
jgi:hypothetical protein